MASTPCAGAIGRDAQDDHLVGGAGERCDLDALLRFGAPLNDLGASDLERPGTVFQIGVPPNRTDIVTTIDGVGFPEAWLERAETTYGDQAVPVIGERQLVRNKRASGRPQDLPDLVLESD